MFDLRNYQKVSVQKAVEYFTCNATKDTPVIVSPTGSGKSIVIAYIAKELGDAVLVLQPSKELLEQNYSKFKAYGGEASIYSASLKKKDIGGTTFATIGSVKNVPELFDHVKYVIIDECHLVPPKAKSMFVSFLNNLGDNVRVLGLTATAFRLKQYRDPFSGAKFSQINILNRERPKFFNKITHVVQIGDLYRDAFLSPIKYIEMAWDDGALRYNSTGADYSDESVERALQQFKIHEQIPGIIKQSLEKGRKHRLVFLKNIDDALMLTEQVPDSACIHSGTKAKEREEILTGFKSGEIKTVFNVNVLAVGFDFPELDTIIIARPTMSLASYIQMIGRGVRQAPGKEDCAVVDMCGNIQRFGKLEDIRYEQDDKKKWAIVSRGKTLSGVRMTQ